MAQTRNTIELLTKILAENGTSRIKAEIFRLAKFNHKDAVPSMWKLLFELIYYCEFGKIDGVSVRAFGELSSEEMVTYVKRELQDRGFYSKEFAVLPSDMSSGSREILLAFGWLLCKENIISRFVRSCTTPIEDDTAALHYQEAGNVTSTVKKSIEESKNDMYTRVQQLLLLNNKLRLSLRNLYALQRENALLKHKIHKATYGAVSSIGNKNHLSEMEVYMLRHPQLLKNNLDLVEQDNQRLQNLLSWRDHEDHFWKWMGSVLDAKLQSRNSDTEDVTGHIIQKNDTTAPSSEPGSCDEMVSYRDIGGRDSVYRSSYHLPQPDLYARLQQSHLTLHEAIVKYEAVIQHLENIWADRSDEITDEDLDSVISSIDQELSVQRANIMLQNCHSYQDNKSPEGSTSVSSYDVKEQQQEPHLIYVSKPEKHQFGNRLPSDDKSAAAASVAHSVGRDSPDMMRHIEEEIRSLNGLVEHLQQEVSEKQNRFKQEMQLLSAKFQDAICIPPMEPKC